MLSKVKVLKDFKIFILSTIDVFEADNVELKRELWESYIDSLHNSGMIESEMFENLIGIY
ncbi:MAG: hypothetical protein GWN01_12175 [Nitrosopumilaceae archaeon]|nr:hypothetical protein [Nitrosopumilaceae archaeon]NIU88051.1 hypothetical protein [Nitrosopumilaceae archaeon]NIX62235.1 hypothetical protein [Nitrosopumilaceae archaeon]